MIKKIISFIIIFILIIVGWSANFFNVEAASTYSQSLKKGINQFPDSYQSKLKKLAEKYPNWIFQAYNTGISWNDLITQEQSGNIHKNRVPVSSPSTWKNSCGFSENGWACASDEIVKYYIDPRNFLNETQIFQFVETSYNSEVQTLSAIQNSVKGTFLDNTITCKDFNGNTITMSYSQIIIKAAQESNISAFYIKSKIIQEVGSKGSNSVYGIYPGYEGYYNFFNFGADDTGDPIANGLSYAKSKSWNSQYKAIIDGAKQIGKYYIEAGQNTAYFNKWDVVGTKILNVGQTQTVSSKDMFAHQYMTNIMDPISQSYSTYKLYKNCLNEKITFIIPVYKDMPTSNSMPQEGSVKSISLSKTDVTLEIDEKCKLEVYYNPTNATNKNVTWQSSNPEVARVWNGEIRGLKKGTSIITVTSQDGEKTASCKITVTGEGKSIPFIDVSKSDWFYEAVKFSYENNIVTGYDNTHFMALENITRGQLITILWRLENTPDTKSLKNKFTDVENGQYYTEAIKWSASKGIITGYGGTTKFGPNDPIIRQDLAIILNRYAKYKGKNSSKNDDLTSFKDYKNVSEYAKEAVKWAIGNEIIFGNNLANGSKTIDPHSNTTRAEAVTMIQRYINKFN